MAPLLLAPFIMQPICWFNSGPSQQVLAHGEEPAAKESSVRGGGKAAYP